MGAHGSNNTGIFDCLTGPCVTVPGVGKLQGSKRSTQWTGRDIFAFHGIPFGETTAGEHRFAPPRPKGPLNNGNDAFDATYLNYLLDWWDHVCPQPGMGATGQDNPMLAQWAASNPDRALPTGPTIGTEDCLHLAVFLPQLPTANSNPNLPVMVYIHGGSFMLGGYIGAGAGKLLERDMVIVEMQYRVGPLGFMCLPDDEIAGNMGLLDQNLALKWVNDHITYFGGDPDRVTIMGESAGSASVTYHMISPLSQPYFKQAIAESGSALSSWAFDNAPEDHAKEIAGQHLGCPTDKTSDLVHCLKNEKSAADIVIAHKKYYSAENYFYSFEHYGDASLWNFLFPGTQPPIPRGVTHGDELIYLFSTGVFNLNDEDWEVARIMSNLWANFVIYGNP